MQVLLICFFHKKLSVNQKIYMKSLTIIIDKTKKIK
jgi:hypothetical protein